MSKTMRTADLIGDLLDEWVARAEGYTIGTLEGSPGSLCVGRQGVCFGMLSGGTTLEWIRHGKYSPSTDPAQAYPITLRELIGVTPWIIAGNVTGWGARKGHLDWFGPTPLIATMRCRVATKFGAEVPPQSGVTMAAKPAVDADV